MDSQCFVSFFLSLFIVILITSSFYCFSFFLGFIYVAVNRYYLFPLSCSSHHVSPGRNPFLFLPPFNLR
ncbi:hypothetical protein C8Q75DRAFT_752927 [Abortiporus biennis]|nr:hypothetical protein C8Q75DRAFT_752927 [Abortiporus biennis]